MIFVLKFYAKEKNKDPGLQLVSIKVNKLEINIKAQVSSNPFQDLDKVEYSINNQNLNAGNIHVSVNSGIYESHFQDIQPK